MSALFELLQERLRDFEPQAFKLLDDSLVHQNHQGNNGGAHLELHIQSAQFVDLPTLTCHRLIYAKLADLIPYPIHALSIKIIRE